jgi:hypothetical protein
MLNGVYRVIFQGPEGQRRGILYVKNGVLVGGDTGFVYKGSYQVTGNQFTGTLQVTKEDPGMKSVFGALSNYQIGFVGQLNSEHSFSSKGSIQAQPGLQISIQGMKLIDA